MMTEFHEVQDMIDEIQSVLSEVIYESGTEDEKYKAIMDQAADHLRLVISDLESAIAMLPKYDNLSTSEFGSIQYYVIDREKGGIKAVPSYPSRAYYCRN